MTESEFNIEFFLRNGHIIRVSGNDKFANNTLESAKNCCLANQPIICYNPQTGKIMAIIRSDDISGITIHPRDLEMEKLLRCRLNAETRYYENLNEGETWKEQNDSGDWWKDQKE